MNLFKRKEPKGEIIESYEDMTGKVLTKVERKGNEVHITIRSRVDGSVLFECRYESNHSDRVVMYDAEQIADVFIKSHGLYEHTKLMNLDMPTFRMSTKKMR